MKESAEQALREHQQRRIWIVETRTRFAMAIAGGLMLIIPMLVMTLVPSRTTSLLTVSMAVLIFSFLIAVASTAKP
jgi:VIT1/CCC1 family predicted Fe2+/Mn2+ transporter